MLSDQQMGEASEHFAREFFVPSLDQMQRCVEEPNPALRFLAITWFHTLCLHMIPINDDFAQAVASQFYHLTVNESDEQCRKARQDCLLSIKNAVEAVLVRNSSGIVLVGFV